MKMALVGVIGTGAKHGAEIDAGLILDESQKCLLPGVRT
jgi:hypothetical protein